MKPQTTRDKLWRMLLERSTSPRPQYDKPAPVAWPVVVMLGCTIAIFVLLNWIFT